MADVSQAAWQAVERGRVKRIGLEVATRIVGVSEGEITLEDFRAAESGPDVHAAANGHSKAAS